MPYTVAEAAKAIGKSKAAVFRAISKGKLSAVREEARGVFLIDPAELHRVFPPVPAASPDTHRDMANGTSRNGSSQPGDTHQFAELQGRLADAHQTIEDLRHRLDQADTDRRQTADRLAAAQERIAALLTDQRPAAAPDSPAPARRRRWWRPWRR
jgi:septal ring factor EnvC (AmiA/AmiB activator)